METQTPKLLTPKSRDSTQEELTITSVSQPKEDVVVTLLKPEPEHKPKLNRGTIKDIYLS